MEVDYRGQLLLALYSFPTGLLLGAVYDILRLFRLPFGKIGVFITDIMQTFLCFISVQILLYNCWNGKIRVYPFFICFIGFVLYRATLGRLFTAVFIKLSSYIKPRVLYRIAMVRGYIYKKRLLRKAAHGFGIKLPRRKRSGKKNKT